MALVGASVTLNVESTVTVVFVGGVVAPAVGLPAVPESVSVTVSTQVAVVLAGVYVSVTTPEFANPGQLPDFTDQA